jgi:capsular exopolysaccharide synthesis family protein
MEPILKPLEWLRREAAEPALRDASIESTPRFADDIVYTHTRCIEVNAALLRERRIITDADEPAADAYKMLCTRVLRALREGDHSALAVVSPGAGDGKTLTAINLALSLAREVEHTVLLVDADLRRPSVHTTFGLGECPGLSDHLLDGTPLQELLIHPGIASFVLLPGGRPVRKSTELLGSAKMRALVAELKARYPERIVVFDLPPVLSKADAVAFAPLVDASLMVVREGNTTPQDIARAAEMLAPANLIGFVLNDSSHPGRAAR